MTGWIVTGCVLLALVLLLQIRVGVWVRFDGDGLAAQVRAGLIRIAVFPPKKPAKRGEHPADKGKGKKAKKPKEKEPSESIGIGGAWEQFQMYAALGIKVAGRLRRKLRIDLLRMDVRWAAQDPAAAALGFGYLSAALSTLVPQLEKAFHVRRREINTGVDFQGTSPTVTAQAACSLTIGQGLMLGVTALTGFVRGRGRLKKLAANRAARDNTKLKKEAKSS